MKMADEVYMYLDRLVDAAESINSSEKDFGIELCNKVEYFNIYEGIFDICKAIGVKPKRKWREGAYDVEVYFEYRGIKFMSLYKSVERDVYSAELDMKDEEKVGIFKNIDDAFKRFDEATKYSHEESGVLGKA